MRNQAIFATLAASAILAVLTASLPIAAQTPPDAVSQTSPGHTTIHRHPAPPHLAHPAKPSPSVPVAQALPTPPLAPRPPDWPANDPPSQANVVWDSHGLSIQAANSSLDQILKDVSTETGAKVQGFSKDQRIFGSYGPGSTREVLSELLDGSGYNLLMVGGRSADDPLQVVLSTRPVGAAPPPAPPTQNDTADNDIAPDEPDQQPPVPLPARMDPNANQQPRTPQQIMQEMLQHQQQQQHNSPF